MVYQKTMPNIEDFYRLAQRVKHYPVTRAKVQEKAWDMGFKMEMVDFLDLFPAQQTFKSRNDLFNRCEELKLLIYDERGAPAEKLRSPQD